MYPVPSEISQKEIEVKDLKGTTLKVYYLLAERQEPLGPREVQRALNLSSPSLALYHLNRLVDARLVIKSPDGKYFIDGDPLKLGELKDHVKVAGVLIPRILLYAYHALISIFFALILYFGGYPPQFWVAYVVGSSLLFVGILIRDARILYGGLLQNKD